MPVHPGRRDRELFDDSMWEDETSELYDSAEIVDATPAVEVQSSITERNAASAVACVVRRSVFNDFVYSVSDTFDVELLLLLLLDFAVEKCSSVYKFRAAFTIFTSCVRTCSVSDNFATSEGVGAR